MVKNYLFSFTQGTAQPVQQNMGNVLKDFVNARTAGKVSLVNRKVSNILAMATNCFTFIILNFIVRINQ